MVAPTLGAAFTKAIEAGRNLGPRGMPVTLERATQVFQDGRVEVNGVRIPVTGSGARGLRAGEMVAVSWQRGQPVVAIRHSARRTGPVSPQPKKLGGVVEELIRAPIAAGSAVRDIWFRNDTVLGRLGINTLLTTSPSGARWGLSRDRFFTSSTGGTFPLTYPIYHVFTIGSADGTLRQGDQVLTDIPVARLEQSYDVSQSTVILGQYHTIYAGGTITYNPPVVLGTLVASEYDSGDGVMHYRAILHDVMLDDRGHVLLSLSVIIFYHFTSRPFDISHIPYIVDLTDDVVIFDGLAQAAALFGITTLNPTFMDLDNIPNLGSPDFHYIDPFVIYTLRFLHAANGDVSLIAGAFYHWEAGTSFVPTTPGETSKTKYMIRTPISSLVLQGLTDSTSDTQPSNGIYHVGAGLSEEYIFWVPITNPTGTGGLVSFLFSTWTPSGVKMTRFVEPTDTEQVAADLEDFFGPRLLLLDPTALYNSTDDNDTGHFFVEYLADGDLELDAAASGFPARDERPGDAAGLLLDYPADLAFIQTFLESLTAGEDAEEAFGSLLGSTSYQLILDTAVVPELPI